MTTQPKTENKNQTEVGALWKRQSQKGQKYLAGHVKYDEMGSTTELKIVVFPITNKKSEKSPDFRIYVSTLASAKDQEKKDGKFPQKTNSPAPAPAPVSEAVAESEDLI